MKIASSSIIMSGKSASVKSASTTENLRYWTGNNQSTSSSKSMTEIKKKLADSFNNSSVIVDISKRAREMQKHAAQLLKNANDSNSDSQDRAILTIITKGSPGNNSTVLKLSDRDKLRIQLIEKFLSALTGKEVKLIYFEDPQEQVPVNTDQNTQVQSDSPKVHTSPSNGGEKRYGWGLSYDYHETKSETQSMSFDTQGTVKTSDGKEIDFSLKLNMDSSFNSQEDFTLRAGDATVDPLVINFDSPAAQLTGSKFSFDIDANGTKDQISTLANGSGYLALDLNSDGKINDGSELFGPKSGNGFTDLSEYDSDKNNWIDENDAVFDKLRIWTRDENGNDQLLALGEKGIGAIYLGNVKTAFDLNDNSNEKSGQISETGIFVREDGTAGTVQHVDLSV